MAARRLIDEHRGRGGTHLLLWIAKRSPQEEPKVVSPISYKAAHAAQRQRAHFRIGMCELRAPLFIRVALPYL